jgi:sulfate permease, SulP family
MAAMGTAATVILTLLFLVPVFSYLPQAALGALVFVAAVGLVDIRRN